MTLLSKSLQILPEKFRGLTDTSIPLSSEICVGPDSQNQGKAEKYLSNVLRSSKRSGNFLSSGREFHGSRDSDAGWVNAGGGGKTV